MYVLFDTDWFANVELFIDPCDMYWFRNMLSPWLIAPAWTDNIVMKLNANSTANAVCLNKIAPSIYCTGIFINIDTNAWLTLDDKKTEIEKIGRANALP
jgi:hypothetical protein